MSYEYTFNFHHPSKEEEYEASVEISSEVSNYGADADGRRGTFIREFEVDAVTIFDMKGNNVSDNEELLFLALEEFDRVHADRAFSECQEAEDDYYVEEDEFRD